MAQTRKGIGKQEINNIKIPDVSGIFVTLSRKFKKQIGQMYLTNFIIDILVYIALDLEISLRLYFMGVFYLQC